jgi:hypothetical protein
MMMHLNPFTLRNSNRDMMENYRNAGTNSLDQEELDDNDLDILGIENLDIIFLDLRLDMQKKEKMISGNVTKSNAFATANNNQMLTLFLLSVNLKSRGYSLEV